MTRTRRSELLEVHALRFAASRHAYQCIPGTELPYLVHVTSLAAEIMATLADAVQPDLAVACSLLHDTLKDTTTTETSSRAPWRPVAAGILALTKDASLPTARRIRSTDSRDRLLLLAAVV